MLQRTLLFATAACLAAASPAMAQLGVPLRPAAGGFTCYPDAPGAWKSEGQNNDARSFGLTVAQGQVLLAKVHEFTTAIRAAGAVNPPLGVNAIAWEDMCCADECRRNHNCNTVPLFGRLWLRLHYFLGQKNGVPFTDSESYADLQIWFNNPHHVLPAPVLTFADGRRAGREPRPWRAVGGVTWYFNGDGQSSRWAFLTASERPLWIPVTAEQFLSETIREREAEYLKVEPGDTFALAREGRAISERMLIEPLRAQLKAMSARERAAQAWYSGRNPMAPLEPPNAPDAYPLVIFNPEYFDRARPRTDLQLAIVAMDVPEEKSPEAVADDLAHRRLEMASDVGNARLWQLVSQVDWAKLGTLIR